MVANWMGSDRNGRIHRAYILAGGKSSRFGSPKALVDIGGMALIDRLCQSLSDREIEPTIVAKRSRDFSHFEWSCIEDELEDAGPLHGIERSLQDCQEKSQSHCWVMTCDLWDWNTAWEEAMANFFLEGSEHCFAILLKTEGHFTPFPGVYAVSGLKSIREAWKQGIRSIRSWQTSIHDRIIKVPIITEAYPQTFNTPEELAKLRSLHGS
jgi:molybdopterin-guanine dinucleotide biosynthesis protein A